MSDLAGQAARIHPWPPMRIHQGDAGIDVGVWGRTYRFANRPLPTSIESAGREILAGPVRLVGELDGEPGSELDCRLDVALDPTGPIATRRRSSSVIAELPDTESARAPSAGVSTSFPTATETNSPPLEATPSSIRYRPRGSSSM